MKSTASLRQLKPQYHDFSPSASATISHSTPSSASKVASCDISGAMMVIHALVTEGVEQCFGYPGGAVIPLYDAMWQYNRMNEENPKDYPKINHFRTTHEQHALHAADGYARATGSVGVAIVTSGPGATNSITGLANAYMDSIPLVVIVGQVPQRLIGRDAFQEVDITGIATPVTKHSFKVTKAISIAATLKNAFAIASSGRPGPVLVEIPKDVLVEIPKDVLVEIPSSFVISNTSSLKQSLYDSASSHATAPATAPANTPAPAPAPAPAPVNYYQLQKATEALRNAKRPVIYAGGGTIASESGALLQQLAELLDAPVVNSLMGLGSISRNHPLSLGLVGMHGLAAANIAISRADVILALGVRFSDRVAGKPSTFAPQSTLIRIDLDPTEHGKNVAEDYVLEMDIQEALKLLLKRFDPQNHKPWHQEIALYHQQARQQNIQLSDCFQALAPLVKNAYVATDVGQHQMWTAQYFPFNTPRQWLTSGGLGTMGFGIGALLGAMFAPDCREGTPLLVTGDGSIRMSMMELLSLKQLGRPAIVLVMNNGHLGMVRQWQHHFCSDRYQETRIDDGANLCRIAEAMGIRSIAVDSPIALRQALKQFVDPICEPASEPLSKPLNELLFIDLHIPEDFGAYPFVPPEASLDAMIF